MDFSQFLTEELARIEAASLRRRLRTLESPQGAEIVCEGRRWVNFSSNDYLGLATHPALSAAAKTATDEAGTGTGASRLICGSHREHERLEEAIARFKRTEAALGFSTGYAAALGVIPALVGEGDIIILDKLCHASMVDGARLSGATLRVFPHNHLEKLDSHLRWAREKAPAGKVLILTESVFSMDGNRAPLSEIVALKERYGAWLFLDEAHAVGVLGENGRGLADAEGVGDRIEIQMGTLGKALGSSGAYICGSAVLREFLINRARSFIFSTAPSPSAAAAARAGIEVLQSADGASRLARLTAHRERIARRFGLSPDSAIFPFILGPEQAALEAAQELGESGFLVPAIRYPTVARGQARLRLTLTAGHSSPQVDAVSAELERVIGKPDTSDS